MRGFPEPGELIRSIPKGGLLDPCLRQGTGKGNFSNVLGKPRNIPHYRETKTGKLVLVKGRKTSRRRRK